MKGSHRSIVTEVTGSAIEAASELDGGMIGTVRRLDLADGRSIVAKTGDTPLSTEARMLEHLADNGLPVPDVYYASDDLLLLAFIEGESEMTPAVERDAADRLARLHDRSTEAFGFPFDTLTGPIEQPNPWTDDWRQFYVEHRLDHVLDLALSAGTIDRALADRLRGSYRTIERLLADRDRPGLIHGDVWRTNLLADGDRVVAFLDPACYYADPEIELAYADWTGTVGDAFFDRYDRVRGIDPGFFDRRRFVYRLYPLLVHVHLFGGQYVAELEAAIDRVEALGKS